MKLKPIEDFPDVWSGLYPAGSARSNQFLIRLDEESLLVISAGTNLDLSSLNATLTGGKDPASVQPPKNMYLVAPNTLHHMGIRKWKEEFAAARGYGHSKFLKKFSKKGHNLEPLDHLLTVLPSHVRAFEAPGTRCGEILFIVEYESRYLWICADSFFHIPQSRMPTGAVGWYLKLSGAAPGLRISRLFKFLGIKHRSAYKEWILNLLDQFEPHTLIVCHGVPLQSKQGETTLKEKLVNLIMAQL